MIAVSNQEKLLIFGRASPGELVRATLVGATIWAGDRPVSFLLIDAVQVQSEQRPLFKVAVLEPEFVQRAGVGDKDPTLRDLELAPSRAARPKRGVREFPSVSSALSLFAREQGERTYMKQRLK